jgi:hypothetical protein
MCLRIPFCDKRQHPVRPAAACAAKSRLTAPLGSSRSNGRTKNDTQSAGGWPTTLGPFCLYACAPCRARQAEQGAAGQSPEPDAPKRCGIPPAVCARLWWRPPSPAGGKTRQQIQRPLAFGCGVDPYWPARWGSQGGYFARPRLHARFLVHTPHPFPSPQRAYKGRFFEHDLNMR